MKAVHCSTCGELTNDVAAHNRAGFPLYRCHQGHLTRAPGVARPPVPAERFDGADYDDERDRARLGQQLQAVYDVMADGRWHTINEVARASGYDETQQSVARQIRYLRAKRFGGHTIERRYEGDGLYSYRLIHREGVAA
jgi:hypothetical protein